MRRPSLRPKVLIAALGVLALCSTASAQNPIFDFILPDTVIPYQASTGVGSATISVDIFEEPSPGYPHNVSGWSMSVADDPSLIQVTEIDQGAYIAAFNGGTGPGFFSPNILPNGFTVGCVYSLLGQITCTYEVEHEDLVVHLETVPSALMGDVDGETTALTWMTLGSPPVSNIIVVNGSSIPTTLISGGIILEPISGFVRGEANGDGQIDFADPIAIFTYLFSGPFPLPCLDAADVNDDGGIDVADGVYIITWFFNDGPPPPTPLEGCGPDPTPDGLGCDDPPCP